MTGLEWHILALAVFVVVLPSLSPDPLLIVPLGIAVLVAEPE